jgi:mRNA-degrading endonuclease YafQ of YafQ-DinJ toxin-antitoxin module
MALELRTTTAFERDLRRVNRQGKDLDKLETIVNLLQAKEPLPARCRPHLLRGIGPDIGIAMWSQIGSSFIE